MPNALRRSFSAAVVLSTLAACAATGSPDETAGEGVAPAGGNGPTGGAVPADDAAAPELAGSDASTGAPSLDPTAACATAVAEAKPEKRPVDIVWMVDNSSSMEPAVRAVTAGLNAFAATIAQKQLDYRVVMLSLRGTKPVEKGGSTRYPVCIPAPLAGNGACGNGPRFVHSNVDVKSTQPLEQLLGTLDQTTGYAVGEDRGGEVWGTTLRPDATKTIVLVTDDESRLSADAFDRFPGGSNPQNGSLKLPPGLLDPSRKGQFDGYVFAAIYGWGSATDPGAKCKYKDGTFPPNAGPTYTELVKRTGGPRAQICDASGAWQPFFDAVAQAVVTNAKVSCELAIPTPAGQTLDPTRVNVDLEAGGRKARLKKAASENACGLDVAWYYDDDKAPTKVRLCPAACTLAQGALDPGTQQGRVEVLFGCRTEVK